MEIYCICLKIWLLYDVGEIFILRYFLGWLFVIKICEEEDNFVVFLIEIN